VRVSESPFLLVAALVHLALPVAAAIAPLPDLSRMPYAATDPQQIEEIDIDVSTLPPLIPQESLRPELPVGTPQPYANNVRPHDDRPFVPPVLPTSNPDAPPPDNADPDSSAMIVNPERGPSDINLPPSASDLPGGIPGVPGTGPLYRTPGLIQPSGPRPGAAPTKAPKRKYNKHAATEALDKGIRAKDKKLGLDLPAASAIAAAIRNAVRGADTPYTCAGSFSVALSPQGRVTAVNLLGFTGGDSITWQHVRKAALASLRSRTFPMRASYAKGALISVSVRSQKKMPGGGTSRSGATLSFDVTDIGAKPTRVVSVGFSATPVK